MHGGKLYACKMESFIVSDNPENQISGSEDVTVLYLQVKYL
jgi:hypothetical protein